MTDPLIHDAIDAKVKAMLAGWRTAPSGEREINAILAKTMALPAYDTMRQRNRIAGIGLALSALAASLLLWTTAPAPLPNDEPLLEQNAYQVLMGDPAQPVADEDLLP